MGATAEVLARDFGITRQEQDEYALESHRRAADAQKRGSGGGDRAGRPTVDRNDEVGPRKDQTLEALAKLKPFFEKDGTVTVGNSCTITDGAAAVLVMPGEAARAEGRRPLGYLRGLRLRRLRPGADGLWGRRSPPASCWRRPGCVCRIST